METEIRAAGTSRALRDPVILCVDDERELLSALRRCFRKESYDVITAGSVEEALGWLAEVPAIDLVLSDERMPGSTGTDLLREMRTRSPLTTRVLLTGFPSETLIRDGLEAGVEIFLSKPWDDRELRDTVRRILMWIVTRLENSGEPSDLGSDD